MMEHDWINTHPILASFALIIAVGIIFTLWHGGEKRHD
jgi:hypothetical protein